MVSFILFLLFVGIVLWASYRKIGLAATTALIGVVLATYTLTGTAASWWKAALWAAYLPLVLLNVAPLRLRFLSRPFFRVYKRMLPAMSSTEQEALEAGTVWWDGELFTGHPDWQKLLGAAPAKLNAEEQAFLDGP